MPSSCEEILRRLGAPKSAADTRLDPDTTWAGTGDIKVQKGPALWPRLEKKS
jgi:hypothetical protein